MPDEPILRTQARIALEKGYLPPRRPDRIWGGAGVGAECALCKAPIPKEEHELELEFVLPTGTTSYHIHPRCYAAWEFERTKLGADRRARPGTPSPESR